AGRLVGGGRVGIGEGGAGAEPRPGGGAGAVWVCFLFLVARPGQMGLRVPRAGGHHLAPHVAYLGAVGSAEARLHRGNLAVLDEHVRRLVEPATRVDHPPALEQQRPHHSVPRLAASASSGRPPASRYSTAIRTATPFVTWSRITLCGPSATRESISTPRFMGPGCMMVRGRGAFSRRSSVTPNTR